MALVLRFDFPPEVVSERTVVFDKINELTATQSFEAVKEAVALHREWCERHPDDYVALEAGGHLLMYYEAFLETEGQSAARDTPERQLVGTA